MQEELKENQGSNRKRALIRLGLIVALSLPAVLVAIDYFMALKIVEISETQGLDARGGEIHIEYNREIKRSRYIGNDPDLAIKRSLSKDRKTEIITLVKPTPYNRKYELALSSLADERGLMGLFSTPEILPITTGMEQVFIKNLIPSESSNPAPETLDNQLVVQFQGEVRGKYRSGVNIPANELPFIKLTPDVRGYYQWSDESTLTFNFTEDKPQYETEYTFEITPDKLINPDYQVWASDKRQASVTTSANEVYVSAVSAGKEVNWQTPVRIEFSGQMVGALDILKPKSRDIVPIDISPAAGGHWVWVNARTIEFQPDAESGWPIRETVTVRVKPEINQDPDRKWRDNPGLSSFAFYVLPRLQSITSYNLRGEEVELDTALTVDFSRNLMDDQAALGERVISDAKPPLIIRPAVKGWFVWAAKNRLKFQPENLWDELTEYTVTLNPEFNPDPRYEWDGIKEFKFKTVENIVHAEFFSTPENRLSPSKFFSDKSRYKSSTQVPPENRLWILFDKELGSKIDQSVNMHTAVKISPAVDGRYQWLSNSLLEFKPEHHWQKQQEYSITLSKKLLYHPQQHFGKGENTFEFETADDIVTYMIGGDGVSPYKNFYKLDPDSSLQVTFTKNMQPVLKIGRTYRSGEVDTAAIPVIVEPDMTLEYRWASARELSIAPVGYWKPETDYRIRLKTDILPVPESHFLQGVEIPVKTSQNIVSIRRFEPTGVVGRRINIDVEFTKNIKPDSVRIGEEHASDLFKITPALTGAWKWLAPNKLRFMPDEPLQISTGYQAEFIPEKIFDNQFTWVNAGKDSKPREVFSFNTPALHVVKTNARFTFDEKNILQQKFYLDMELSTSVKEEDLKRNFTIWYDKTTDDKKQIKVPLLYSLETENNGNEQGIRKFSVVSDWIDRPANDRRIYYQIAAGLKPVVGNLELLSDYRSDFLQEKPKHIRLDNINWVWQDNRYKAVVNFNSPIEPDRLEKFLTVKTTGTGQEKILSYEVNVANSGYNHNFSYEVFSEFIPGSHYDFMVSEGLLAADGAFTTEAIKFSSQAPDLGRKLAFAYDGNVLSRFDLGRVPIMTSNIEDFTITIEQVYANNVSYFINNNIDSADISKLAKVIHKKKYRVSEVYSETQATTKNKELIAHIDLVNLLDRNRHGLYRISLHSDYVGHSRGSQRWFLATDTGLVARRFDNNIVVWANDLSSLQAKSGMQIEVIDTWNQVIGRGVTDHDGFARIRVEDGASPSHITARQGDDFAFLDFRKHRDPLSDYDISGISSKHTTLRSFIYSERGVYRPGETAHLVSVTRGRNGVLPEIDLPVSFQLIDPTGKEFIEEKYNISENGIYSYDFPIPVEAKTGKWQAVVKWKNEKTGIHTFQVEEFIPNKIKVELKKLEGPVTAGGRLKFQVEAKNLFGPPAAGRHVSGTVSLRPQYYKPEGYARFHFGHDENEFQRIDAQLVEARLDDNGLYVYEYPIPDGIDSPIGLSAHYSATVLDDGGRGVSSYAQTDVLLYSQFVGVRRLNDAAVSLGESLGFEVANVDAEGNPVPRAQQNIEVRIYRNKHVTHYRKNERGYYRYVTEKERILVDKLGDPRDEQGKFEYTPQFSGEHILEVVDAIGQQVTRYKFTIRGPRDSVERIAASDKVELKVLNSSLGIGEVADLEIRAPFVGKLLLTGESDHVLFTRAIDLQSLRDVVRIPIPQTYFPNFYVSATLIKPVKEGNRQNPVYAGGLLNVPVIDHQQTPAIRLDVPSRANPNGKMKVSLKIDDSAAQTTRMQYTVAAVDVGILDLTKYELPDMKGYFNEKRKLEVEHYSLYPMLVPYEPDSKGIIEPSGDAPSRALIKKKRVNPESQLRVKSVALWSGVLETDEFGNGEVVFDLPDFDGTLRVMAVAYGDQRFVSAQSDVLVRDKLVAKPILPRFLATGDNFTLPVSLFNGTGQSGEVKVTVTASDHVKVLGPASKTISLKQNGEALIDFAYQVNNHLGVSNFEIVAQGLGEVTRKTINVPVRTPGTLLTFNGSGEVDSLTPKTVEWPDNFIEGTQDLAMHINSNLLTRFQGGLSYLLRYPHGCLEQTTSKAFPLLYYREMAVSAGDIFTPANTPKYYAQEAVKKIEGMQREDGSFSYWQGQSIYNSWSAIYASHFLVEAKNSGLKVSDASWNNMIYFLDQLTGSEISKESLYNRDYGVSHMLYALYVQALANENVLSRLNHIYNAYGDSLKPHDKARLAAAYALAKNEKTAKEIIATLDEFNEYDNPYRDTGGSFGSNTRDLAIILDSLVTVDPKSGQIPVLIDMLATRMHHGRWGTTQDNAFAFLAIGKAVANSEALKTKATITLGDGTQVPFERDLLLKTPELLKGKVRIEVEGSGSVNFVWEAIGIEQNPQSLQVDEGLEVRRRFLNKDGEPADLSNVKQGDLLVAEIKIQSLTSRLDNVVITDLLPSGLEIENARLSTSASLSWLQPNATTDYVDIRDDRISVFLTVPTSVRTYYYTVRAVTMGNFDIPAIHAEAMYSPEIYSKSSSGKLKVLRKEGRSEFAIDL